MSGPARFSGKLGIALLFAVGGGATLWAILFWRNPENSVRWAFTQFHSSLIRKRTEQAAQFVAPRVSLPGREAGREEFMASYALPPKPEELSVAPCAKTDGHWTVTMGASVYCFSRGTNAWRIHRVGGAPCDCR